MVKTADKINKTGKSGLDTAASVTELPFSVRLRISENNLTAAEKKIGQYFLSNPNAIFLSITEVVQDSGIGYGTVVRFCQKLGCAGFQEFKVLLAQEVVTLNRNTASDEAPSDINEYSRKIFSDLENTQKLFDPDTLTAVAKAINNARRVLITGIAGSASLAVGLDYHLSRIGINCSAVCEGYNLAIRAAVLDKNDLFFAISFSGSTKDILAAAQIARESGAKTVSLTNFIHAPLIELSDYNLFSSTDRDPLSCEIFSNCAANFVLDVLFCYVFKLRKDAKKIVDKTFAAISDRRV
jgi:DNA-binding MurR/RpiR family transcriptional regulator